MFLFVTIESTVFMVASLVVALFMLYIVGIVWLISSVLITPPHYAHRKPTEGLAKQGKPIDPVWQPHISDPLTDFGLPYMEIHFHAADVLKHGPTLRGWYIPSTNACGFKRGVIGVHGGGRDRREFHRFVPWLHKANYEVILFDYREHGISDGNGQGLDWGLEAYQDVLGAARYAHFQLGWKRIACLGASNGAVLSLLAAAFDEGVSDKSRLIDAVIAESPYISAYKGMNAILRSAINELPKWIQTVTLLSYLVPLISKTAIFRLKTKNKYPVPVEEVAHLISPRPVFLIHGTADRRFPTTHSSNLFELLPQSSKELWIVPGGRHTEVYEAAPLEYAQRVLSFLNKYLSVKS